MSRLIHALVLIPVITACGNSGTSNNTTNPLDTGSSKSTTSDSTSTSADSPTPSPNNPGADAMYAEQIAQANGYCVNQKKLQIISTSLLSAYTPKGNRSDLNYCGGENVYNVDGANFTLQLNNYCVNARGQQVVLNGRISGQTDSGSNFFSTIIEDLTIAGEGIDLDITGSTRDGRADDNFVDLQVTDNNDGSQLSLNDTSIKKGEFDFGDVTFDGSSQIPFKFIDYFNPDNTTGLLFLYGQGEDFTVVSGDKGMITAVYKKDRHDPGTWLDLPCNN
jgi:hypothetical protein